MTTGLTLCRFAPGGRSPARSTKEIHLNQRRHRGRDASGRNRRRRGRTPWHGSSTAYRDGEYVYQDFLYDDHGDGSVTYPDEPGRYAANAADFVELRLKPLGTATAVRITYNTLIVPDVVATTLALGDSSEARQWPHKAGVTSPARVFVTAHGNKAEVVDAASGSPIGADIPVTVDLERRQIELRIPHGVFDPSGGPGVRVAAGTGVWDSATGEYRREGDGARLFNLAFRFTETKHPRGIPVATWWRNTRQSAALADGDVSEFAARVDFSKLARNVDDDMPGQPGGVPTSGSMTRIYVSHFSDGQGRGTTTSSPTACEPPECSVQFRGALQPYFVHVPAKRPEPGGYGLTAYLHGCGNNQHELFGSRVARELSEIGPATLVIAGGARGDCLWYQGVAMANMFEIWADAATRYRLDPDIVTLTGYSMGGYGTFRTATLYPELFARVLAIHPCTSTSIAGTGGDPILASLPSLRHVPVALWNSVDDPLCTYPTTRQVHDDLDGRGYATSLHTLANDHFTDITNDVLTPAIDWVAGKHVTRDPARVSYVVHPEHAYPQYGLNPDHTYWVTGLRVRDESAAGTVDVRSSVSAAATRG
jgi:predicted esterase